MTESRPSLDLRALVRDLPDLLAGPEPVLHQPRAREWIARNPQAQGALAAAAAIVTTMNDGRGRLRRSAQQGGRFARSVARASRWFAHELFVVLYEEGRRRYAIATEAGGTFVEGTHDDVRLIHSKAPERRRLEMLRSKLEAPPSAVVRAFATAADSATATDPGRSRGFFEASAALAPGDEQTRWWLGVLADSDRAPSAANWSAEASAAKSPTARGFFLERAADGFARAGHADEASAMSEIAMQLLPDFASVAYHAVLHALLRGDGRLTRSATDALNARVLGRDSLALGLARASRQHDELWAAARRAHPVIYRETIRLLPSALVESLESSQ